MCIVIVLLKSLLSFNFCFCFILCSYVSFPDLYPGHSQLCVRQLLVLCPDTPSYLHGTLSAPFTGHSRLSTRDTPSSVLRTLRALYRDTPSSVLRTLRALSGTLPALFPGHSQLCTRDTPSSVPGTLPALHPRHSQLCTRDTQ